MEECLLGYWRVDAIEMVKERMVGLVGGLPGETVEFTKEGEYVLWGDPRRPSRSRYRTFRQDGQAAIDIWIEGLETIPARGLYRFDGPRLVIGLAGDSGPRPTEIRRDDERLWCVLSLGRSGPPRRWMPAKPIDLLEPGSPIPEELFDTLKKRKTTKSPS